MLLITIFIILHFVFDWILQPRKIAKNKKKNDDDLGIHIFFNIVPLMFIISTILWFLDYNINGCVIFYGINVISHTLIDKYLPSGKNERQMINWTAIDQILHLGIMIMSLELLKFFN